MAIHSSVLAWRIPGMVAWWASVCGLPSMGSQSRTRLKRLSSSSSKACGVLKGNMMLGSMLRDEMTYSFLSGMWFQLPRHDTFSSNV